VRTTRTDFVNEDDGRLQFERQREDGGRQLLGLAVPLVGQRGRLQVDEAEARLFGRRLGDESLAAPGRTVEQHAYTAAAMVRHR